MNSGWKSLQYESAVEANISVGGVDVGYELSVVDHIAEVDDSECGKLWTNTFYFRLKNKQYK